MQAIHVTANLVSPAAPDCTSGLPMRTSRTSSSTCRFLGSAFVMNSVAAARSLTRRVDLPVISTIAGDTLILLQEMGWLLVTR